MGASKSIPTYVAFSAADQLSRDAEFIIKLDKDFTSFVDEFCTCNRDARVSRTELECAFGTYLKSRSRSQISALFIDSADIYMASEMFKAQSRDRGWEHSAGHVIESRKFDTRLILGLRIDRFPRTCRPQ